MRSLLLAIVLLAACTRMPSGLRHPGGSGGRAGTGGSGGDGGSGGEPAHRWTADEAGDVGPLVLAADGSHVVYGKREAHSLVGSLRVLVAGDREPFEVSPSALVDLPDRFTRPEPRTFVEPAPDGSGFLYRTVTQRLSDDWPPPHVSRLLAFDVATRTSTELSSASVYGPWAYVPSQSEVVFVDEGGVLRRAASGGGASFELARAARIRGDGAPLSTFAAIAPEGDAIAVRNEDGVFLVDMRTGAALELSAATNDATPPAFSTDGARLGFRRTTAEGSSFVVLERKSGDRFETTPTLGAWLSPDLLRLLSIDGNWENPGPVLLRELATGSEQLLAQHARRADFTADGRWVWALDGMDPDAELLLQRTDGGPAYALTGSCVAPDLDVDASGTFVIFLRCTAGNAGLVAHRFADGSEQELGPGRVEVVDPEGRGALIERYLPTGGLGLATWDAATGEVRDRGTTFENLANASQKRVLVMRPGEPYELHVIDPITDDDWLLDAAQPTSWDIGERRVAWSNGSQVILADLP